MNMNFDFSRKVIRFSKGYSRFVLQSLREMAPEYKRERMTLNEMREILRDGPVERSPLGTIRLGRPEPIKQALNNQLTGSMDK